MSGQLPVRGCCPLFLVGKFADTFPLADEYRKTIAKDPALDRRFQPVTIEEPTVESTISILRGLKSRYEVRAAPTQHFALTNICVGPPWRGNI